VYAGNRHTRKHKTVHISHISPSTQIPSHPNILHQPNIEQEVYRNINDYRISHGLSKLMLNEHLSNIARQHSQNMALDLIPMGHVGFEHRVEQISKNILIGENVAWNRGSYNPTQSAITGWLNSSHHHENIVGQYNLTGIGVVLDNQNRYVFTQIFAQK